MKIETKYVSPEMAEALLSSNPVNRAVSHSRVLTFANAMRQGKWQLNGETIIISESGKLLDGQHRMLAIIEFGAPVQMLLAYGASDVSFETIDTGRARTAADIAGMNGVENPLVVSAAAGLLWRLFHHTGVNEVCPPFLTLRIIERFPALHKWGPFVAGVGSARRVLPPGSFLAALVYLEDIALKPRAAERFFDGIIKGADLPDGSPILALRNRVQNLRASGGIINATTCWAPIARVLTAIEAGETLHKLPIEASHGQIRRPALWSDHVAGLTPLQRLTDLRTREQSGGTGSAELKSKVTALRTREAARA